VLTWVVPRGHISSCLLRACYGHFQTPRVSYLLNPFPTFPTLIFHITTCLSTNTSHFYFFITPTVLIPRSLIYSSFYFFILHMIIKVLIITYHWIQGGKKQLHPPNLPLTSQFHNIVKQVMLFWNQVVVAVFLLIFLFFLAIFDKSSWQSTSE